MPSCQSRLSLDKERPRRRRVAGESDGVACWRSATHAGMGDPEGVSAGRVDTDPVLDVVMDRLLDLQDSGLMLFVVTDGPLERTIAMREAAQAHRRIVVPTS